MRRRQFIKLGGAVWTLGFLGCGRESALFNLGYDERPTVTLYDTYAMALYMDGGLGPKTGLIKVEYVVKGENVEMEFWHGHGGVSHRYTITQDHFRRLKKLEKVYIETTEVDDHTHKLFIDMKDPKWRVPGAKPVEVPVEPLH